MKIGSAIRMCRLQRRLSQTKLAQQAGISVSYLSLLEKDQRDPALSTVEGIASALRIPVSVLFFIAAERGELVGMSPELEGRLAKSVLDLLAVDAGA